MGRGPHMEFDLELGPEIIGGEANPEESESLDDTVTFCANVSLLVLFCIVAIVAVVAFEKMPFGPALALTAVLGTVFLVLMLVITAARDKHIGKRLADNVGGPK